MQLTDDDILQGWRMCDSRITRDYFYPYCRMAWYLSDRRYDLASKQDMDYFSLTHEYYIKLAQKDWEPLDHRSEGVSLRTYLVNGYHFLVLDELRVYQRHQRLESFEERSMNGRLHFDLAEDTTNQDFRNAIEDICSHLHDMRDKVVLHMRLVDGYKGKEISQQLHITPAAVSQRFHRLWLAVVLPYFRGENPFWAAEAKEASMRIAYEASATQERSESCPPMESNSLVGFVKRSLHLRLSLSKRKEMEKELETGRITPNRVTTLAANEVFVFGSNLAGMHGGGAARTALLRFGAVLGQGVGMQGQSYAIPTMQGSVETIRPYVEEFIDYAKKHADKTFLVTEIGCGIAGFTPEDIAPLFRDAMKVKNISLPRRFWDVLERQSAWG